MLSKTVGNIHGQIKTVDELKQSYDTVIEHCKQLRKIAVENNIWIPCSRKGWSPMREWEEMSGENRREIKFLKEEVYPICKFYETRASTIKLRCFNDNRNYDAELISPDNKINNHLEISFPRDGKYEVDIEKTITQHGIWHSGFNDSALEWNDEYCNGSIVMRIIKKKSEKNYPKNTILIIMAGSVFPHFDDFDNSKPNPAVERFWDTFVINASKISNSFVEIWLIDRQSPFKIRQIK